MPRIISYFIFNTSSCFVNVTRSVDGDRGVCTVIRCCVTPIRFVTMSSVAPASAMGPVGAAIFSPCVSAISELCSRPLAVRMMTALPMLAALR